MTFECNKSDIWPGHRVRSLGFISILKASRGRICSAAELDDSERQLLKLRKAIAGSDRQFTVSPSRSIGRYGPINSARSGDSKQIPETYAGEPARGVSS
jgi:hypothetical protein